MQEIFFTILVIWILFRIFGRTSFTTTYTFNQNNYHPREEKKKDDVKIDHIPRKDEQKKKGGDEGEYTDFEEIK